MINNIAIASDHAGYELKQYLIDNLGEEITIKEVLLEKDILSEVEIDELLDIEKLI